jgi:hypothetical protein
MWISAMARQDLDALWTVLETQPPNAGIEVTDTGYTVAAGAALAGLDSQLRRQVLIPLLPGEAAHTDTRGRAVHVVRVAIGQEQFLALQCLSPDLHTVFTQFARELLVSVEGAPSPARAASQVFERWRALFSEAAQRGLLGAERLIGLLGELLTLEILLRLGAPSDLAIWAGPSGQQHDFRTPSHALEVKSTLVREGRIVCISSIDQLDVPVGVRLWLAHHRLDRDPAGFNLPEVVQRVLSQGGSRSRLATHFDQLGVDLEDLGAYVEARFRLAGSWAYDVKGPDFPRITRSSFNDGMLPPGTLRFSYSIDLTNQPPIPLTPELAEELYADIAEDAAHGMGS